jgi:hypothetical protein
LEGSNCGNRHCVQRTECAPQSPEVGHIRSYRVEPACLSPKGKRATSVLPASDGTVASAFWFKHSSGLHHLLAIDIHLITVARTSQHNRKNPLNSNIPQASCCLLASSKTSSPKRTAGSHLGSRPGHILPADSSRRTPSQLSGAAVLRRSVVVGGPRAGHLAPCASSAAPGGLPASSALPRHHSLSFPPSTGAGASIQSVLTARPGM